MHVCHKRLPACNANAHFARDPFHYVRGARLRGDTYNRLKNLHSMTVTNADVTRIHFSAGTAAIRDGHSIAAVAGPNARWNCGIILFDPRHGVPILPQNGRGNEALQLRDSCEFYRTGGRL